MIKKELFDGVYLIDGRLATINLSKGKKVYGEELIAEGKVEYRLWNPYRSKLSAAILNGLMSFKIHEGSSVLYIGAATGTTSSHVSDIVGDRGRVYCVELSERNMRELIRVCETRKNMLPILADARHTDGYLQDVGMCDCLYQDASAREQAAILKANSSALKKGGYAYFVIKSQSIDISRNPEEVFREELEKLDDTFELIEKVELEPYDKMHLFAALRKL
jgi:fibrillarin-like pre-rRNA processing protein